MPGQVAPATDHTYCLWNLPVRPLSLLTSTVHRVVGIALSPPDANISSFHQYLSFLLGPGEKYIVVTFLVDVVMLKSISRG